MINVFIYITFNKYINNCIKSLEKILLKKKINLLKNIYTNIHINYSFSLIKLINC